MTYSFENDVEIQISFISPRTLRSKFIKSWQRSDVTSPKNEPKFDPDCTLMSIFLTILPSFFWKINILNNIFWNLLTFYIKIKSYLWQIWDNHTKAVNLLKWIKESKLGGPFILDFARLRLAACCQGTPHLHIKNTGSQRRSMQYG